MVRKLLTDNQRRKEDNSDDSLFYAMPRFVHHLDINFRSRLTKLYKKRISEKSVLLDLMSSWVSHLPDKVKYKRVIGHGLNRIELERNIRLDSFWVQDLNINHKLPLDDSSIDVCLMAAAWQYLQYPEEIAAEIKRVVSPGGLLIVSFSNRAFWIKTPSVWKESSDSGRIDYVRNVLTSQGWSDIEVVIAKEEYKRIFPLLGRGNDPFFSVIATR